VVELIYPPNQHGWGIFRQPQQQEEEKNPPNPPTAGADLAVAAQMRIMQQMVDTMVGMHAQMWQEHKEMCQERERRCARKGGCNSSKYHHHHHFHPETSTGNL
jgi:hypothetical protein